MTLSLDALWPELEPSAALNNLHKALFVVRRALEPETSGSGSFVHFQADSVSLEVTGGLNVDATQFEILAADASATGSIEAYEAAIAVFGGELLPDDLYEDWALTRREELNKRFQLLLGEYAELMEASGRPDEAITAIQRVLAIDPALESAHVRLMNLHTMQGDRHRAIRQYQTLEQVLKGDFGIEPQQETVELYKSILGGRTALASSSVNAVKSETTTVAAAADFGGGSFTVPEFSPSSDLFAGRQSELESIQPIIDDLERGHGTVVLVSGPAGAGKSRLSQEFAVKALKVRPAVLRGGATNSKEHFLTDPLVKHLTIF